MQKISELDGLRGLLSWWVLTGHLLSLVGFSAEGAPFILGLVMNGGIAVNIFIMLSGFVVCLLLEREHIHYLPFITRRFFRLFPVYFICLFIGFAGSFANSLLPREVHARLGDLPSLDVWHSLSQFPVFHWLLHLTMLHGVVPQNLLPYAGYTLVGPAWSISLEWQFYLVAPFLRSFAAKSYKTFLVLAVGAIVLTRISMRFSGSYSHASFLPFKLDLFLLGGLSYYGFAQLRKMNVPGALARYMCGVSFVLPSLLAQKSSYFIPLQVWIPVLTLVSIANDQDLGWFRHIRSALSSKPIQALGQWSYCTYLIHLPVFYLVRYALLNLFPTLIKIRLLGVMAPISIPIILLASAWIYNHAERPGIKFGKKMADLVGNK